MTMTDQDALPPPRWTAYRTALAGWGFFATFCLYILRINFSVAIVCMTYDATDNATEDANGSLASPPVASHAQSVWSLRQVVYGSQYETDEEYCPNNGTAAEQTGEFDWDRELRGILTSSFFWGYVLTQFPGGWLAQIFGGKKLITVGLAVSALMSLLSPPAARLSPYALAMARFLNGIGQGVFYPSFGVMAGYWFPLSERAFLLAFYGSGATLGSVVSFSLSGVLCAQIGWPWIFYTYALLTLIFLVCWHLFVYDTPALHPRITEPERKFIEASLGAVKDKKMPPVPWRHMLLAPTVWALALTDFCNNWAAYAGLTQLPQYMQDVLQFDITQNGLFSSLPTLVKFCMNFVFALIGDFIVKKGLLRVTVLRKTMSSIGFLIPTCFVIGVGYLGCDTAGLAILFLVLQEGFNAAQQTGYLVSRVDIAPPFAGVTMGICNTSANMAGIFAPLVIGMVTVDGTREQWQLCFLMSALMYLVAWLSYMVFGRSEPQKWATQHLDGHDNLAMEIDEKGDVTSTTSYDHKPGDHTSTDHSAEMGNTSLNNPASQDVIVTHM